jgi:Icc-related predicted phosphoesterase
MDELWDFNLWVGEQKRNKGFFSAFLIAGNHDTTMADLGAKKTRAVMSNMQYLHNSEMAVPGTDIRVYGTPLHLPNNIKSTNKSFQPFERGSAELKEAYAAIPVGVDVLLTHGPPTGLGKKSGDSACTELEATLQRVEPFLHVHGHNHHGYGSSKVGRTTVVNACQLNGMFTTTRKQLPVVMDLTEEALQAHRMKLAQLSEAESER